MTMPAIDEEPFSSRSMINLRYVATELWRSRRVWLVVGLVGLTIGALYQIAVAPTYRASTLLVLAHNPTLDPDSAMATDVVLAQALPVAQRVVAVDHLSTPAIDLAKRYTATSLTNQILQITATAPSRQQAVQLANTVASAYLSFRSTQLQDQNQVVTNALAQQARVTQAQIDTLTRNIDAASTASSTSDLADAVAQRSTADSQLDQLNSTILSDQLTTTSITQGSRVVSTAVPARHSLLKAEIVNGASGLVGGLAVAIAGLVTWILLSQRLRRREDIAAALGAPVAINAGRLAWEQRTPFDDTADIEILVDLMTAPPASDGPRRCAVISIDSDRLAARLVADSAMRVQRTGLSVAVVDLSGAPHLTEDLRARSTARASKARPQRPHGVDSAARRGVGAATDLAVDVIDGVRLMKLSLKEAIDSGRGRTSPSLASLASERLGSADVLVVLSSLHVEAGPGQLATWASDAVAVATAGRTTGTTLHSAGTLMRQAGLSLRAVLVGDADLRDDTVAAPVPSTAVRPVVDLVGT